ncbi:MAG: DUF3817 domain-containing protein [Deltaproteobacteria bacterium]|nr:DUF3817 domain-containing protein [Deltaproteobacteria bacterium]
MLRIAAFVEGISFLLLLFIAMPLKYLYDQPEAVRVVGMVHGMLFLWFVAALFRAHTEREWALGASLRVFVASLLPFGFLWIDRHLRPSASPRPAAPPTA